MRLMNEVNSVHPVPLRTWEWLSYFLMVEGLVDDLQVFLGEFLSMS